MGDWSRYGARPGHLVVLLVGFALAGYAVITMMRQGGFAHVVAWFTLGVIGVDLFLWPAAALADHWALGVARRHPAPVPFINHLRVPVIISGTLLAISFPLVLGLSSAQYRSLSGASEAPYLTHWLLVTAALFAASATIYLIRVALALRTGATHRQIAATRGPGGVARDQAGPTPKHPARTPDHATAAPNHLEGTPRPLQHAADRTFDQ